MSRGGLSTASNLADPDAAFRLLVETHRGLSEAESAALDSALVLVLANHVGDLDVLAEALALAKRSAHKAPDPARVPREE